MNSLLFGICISALLSVTSVLMVLLQVSPLTSPKYAIPAFFLTMFLAVSSVSTLVMMQVWKRVPHHTWDTGKLTRICLRQGLLLGTGTLIALLFHLLELLNWWIALLIYGVFILIEMALDH